MQFRIVYTQLAAELSISHKSHVSRRLRWDYWRHPTRQSPGVAVFFFLFFSPFICKPCALNIPVIAIENKKKQIHIFFKIIYISFCKTRWAAVVHRHHDVTFLEFVVCRFCFLSLYKEILVHKNNSTCFGGFCWAFVGARFKHTHKLLDFKRQWQQPHYNREFRRGPHYGPTHVIDANYSLYIWRINCVCVSFVSHTANLFGFAIMELTCFRELQLSLQL